MSEDRCSETSSDAYKPVPNGEDDTSLSQLANRPHDALDFWSSSQHSHSDDCLAFTYSLTHQPILSVRQVIGTI